MDEDRKFVEEHWERAEVCSHGYSHADPTWEISLGGRMFTKACVPEPNAKTEDEAWSAAKAFTEARLKQIADQKNDVAWVQGCVNAMRRLLGENLSESDRRMADEQMERGERVLSREQSILAVLKAGMREE